MFKTVLGMLFVIFFDVIVDISEKNSLCMFFVLYFMYVIIVVAWKEN